MKKLLLILICLFGTFEVNSKMKMSDLRFVPVHWGNGSTHMMDKRKTIDMGGGEYWIYTLVNFDSQIKGFQSTYRFMMVNCKKNKFKLITTVSYEKEWGGGKIIERKDHLTGFHRLVNFWKKPPFPSGDDTLVKHTCVDYKKEKDGSLENWVGVLYNDIGDSFIDMNNVKKKENVVTFSQLVNLKKKEDDSNLMSIKTQHVGQCDSFESKLIKICGYDDRDGKGNLIEPCRRVNEKPTKGVSQKKIVEKVCGSCENLHQVYFKNSGKKLKDYECDLEYFKSVIVKDSLQ